MTPRCAACADEAVPAWVVALLGEGMAQVQTHRGIQEVNIELVDAAIGDTVLVHAGVAIGKLG